MSIVIVVDPAKKPNHSSLFSVKPAQQGNALDWLLLLMVLQYPSRFSQITGLPQLSPEVGKPGGGHWANMGTQNSKNTNENSKWVSFISKGGCNVRNSMIRDSNKSGFRIRPKLFSKAIQ